MRIMAKSAVAEAEKIAKEAGEELAKSFDDVMAGLDTLIKGDAGASAAAAAKAKAKEKDADAEELAKSIQAADEKKAKEKTAVKEKETAEELAKSLHVETVKVGEGEELDAEKVLAEFRKSIGSMIAKAVVSVRESLIEHVDMRMAEAHANQVIIAKALVLNGKLMKESMHEVALIGEQPRGRKSALTMFDKSMSGNAGAAAKDDELTLDPQKVIAKAVSLNAEKKLMPQDVGVITHYVQGGHGIPPRYAHLFTLAEVSQ